MPQAGWLKPQQLIFSHSERLEVQDQAVSRAGPFSHSLSWPEKGHPFAVSACDSPTHPQHRSDQTGATLAVSFVKSPLPRPHAPITQCSMWGWWEDTPPRALLLCSAPLHWGRLSCLLCWPTCHDFHLHLFLALYSPSLSVRPSLCSALRPSAFRSVFHIYTKSVLCARCKGWQQRICLWPHETFILEGERGDSTITQRLCRHHRQGPEDRQQTPD